MNKDVQLLRTVELAAIAAYKYIGSKDKYNVDKAAVEAMEIMLNSSDFEIKVIVGEGELDDAPMLYVDQVLGKKNNQVMDIAVDPVEGTNPAAFNYAGSITCLSASKANTMLKIPEMYMEKLFVKHKYKDHIDLNHDIYTNIKIMQTLSNRKDIKCIILDKPRHQEIISKISKMGVIVRLINDGDVLAAIDVVNQIADFSYGIGGAPEGLLMASLAISSNCKMQAKLVHYDQIWPNEPECSERMAIEVEKLEKLNLKINHVYEDIVLIKDLGTRFFAAGITAGGSLQPIDYNDGNFYINAMFSNYGIVRNINSKYNIDKIIELKPEMSKIIKKYSR